MTVEVVNALYRYFKGLYELNQNIIILCGVDVIDNSSSQYGEQIENVIHLVPKLVPYKYDKKNHIYRLENGDGLLEFENEIPFIKTGYEDILKNHEAFLSNIKAIRNKLEHKMHGATVVASSSGSSYLFEIIYMVNGKRIKITAGELIAFVKELNTIFSEIQRLVLEFSFKENKTNHPYYRRLTKFSFQDFSKIYDSDLLRIFGKTLLPF